jgi:hypothetical protein
MPVPAFLFEGLRPRSHNSEGFLVLGRKLLEGQEDYFGFCYSPPPPFSIEDFG